MARTPVLLVMLVILAIAALVVAFAPLMEVTRTDIETRATTETFTRTETHTEEVVADYEVIEASSANMWWRRSSDCWVTLRNAGNITGWFRIEFDLLTEGGQEAGRVVWQNLDPGKQSKVAVRTYDDYVNVDSFAYTITPPVEVVTSSWEVEDVRDVVEDIEVETTDRVSVLEYLRKWRGQA